MAADSDATGTFTGAEPFLIGLSPQYWAHTPLLIGDLCNLGLVDGVDCLIVKSAQDGKYTTRLIPLSKCRIEGVVVNVERKSNGSVLYLLDDGTGMVDCIFWNDDDVYSLPPLVETIVGDKMKFRVGDFVRVMGKIKCVFVGAVRETVIVANKTLQVRDCIREVQANLMEKASPRGAATALMELESRHWLECIHFRTRGTIAPEQASAKNSMDEDRKPLCNGVDVLKLLGPDIVASVCDRSDFPAANDTFGAWRLFGANCQCDVPYRDSLLYCYCQATKEALDPDFKFRDALLGDLLQMEQNLPLNDDSMISHDSQLRFPYKDMLNNEQLASMAQNVVAKTENPDVNARRLFIGTFRALRKDGILHLVDRDADTYLLVSRERVLEPYIKSISGKGKATTVLQRKLLRSERPAYLSNVPSARVQYIKKKLFKEESS